MALVLRLLPLLVGSALLALAQPAITPAAATLPNGTTGQAYAYAFGATGGIAPYTFQVVGGSLPFGVTLASGGLLSGTPSTAFNGSFSIEVRDAANATSTRTFNLRIFSQLTIVTVGFQSTPFGASFSQCLAAQGGTIVDGASNGTWNIVSGSLPPGITLVNQSPNCGPLGNRSAELTGIPTAVGSFVFTLQVNDTVGQIAQRQYAFNVLTTGPIVVTPTQLSFTCQVGGLCSTGAVGVNINSGGGGTITGLTIAVVSAGGNWLRVTNLNTSTTPAALQVFVDPALVTTAGTFQGSITVSANATPSVTIPVTLNAIGQVTLSVSASQLNFTLPGPGQTPPAQTFTVSSSGPSEVPFTATAISGFPYVLVSQSSDRTPAVVTVALNITGLPLGLTTGMVQITANATNSPINVPVNINPNVQSTLQVFPAQLAFNYATGSPSPQAQAFNVSSNNPGLQFTTTQSAGTPWLVVANAATQTPGQVVIAVNPVGLAPGTRSGIVTVTPVGGGGSVQVPVTFTITTAISNLILSPPTLNFNFQIGGGAPQEQTIAVNSSRLDAPLAFTAAISSATGASWLRISSTTGTTPGFFNVGLNVQNLGEGTYNATIVVQAEGAGNNPQTVPVTLTVARQFSFTASPNSLNFTGVIGSAPQTQAVQLTALSPPLGFVATSSSAWLSVSPNGGSAPATLGIAVNPQGLGPGTYQGNIQITSTITGAQTLTIPVTLTLTSNSQLRVAPTALTFSSNEGTAPAAQNLQLTSSTTPIPYTLQTNQPWLGLSQTGGTTPGSPLVTILPAGLTVGTYRGEIRVTTSEPGNVPILVPVTYTVTAAPRIPQIRAITNAASFLITNMSPLMIFTIFGDNLEAEGGRLLIDGVPAQLLYTSPNQWTGIAPASIANQPRVSVQPEVNGTLGNAVPVAVVPAAPAIFTMDASGRGQAAALNQSGELNTALSPATPGSIVVFYVAGAGALAEDATTLVSPLQVEIDGQNAEILYAGQAPGQVLGLTQVNARVPTGVRSGAIPVVVRSGGFGSTGNVTIEIQP